MHGRWCTFCHRFLDPENNFPVYNPDVGHATSVPGLVK